MNETVSSMNGTLWIFAILLIAWVIVQSLLFLRLALKYNKKYQLATTKELKSAARTGMVSVIGPSVSVIVIALTLISMVGPAVSFMRTGVIGAPVWELMMADIAAQAIGIDVNSPEFTPSVFVLVIFGMTVASAPYFLNTIITLKPLDMAIAKNKQIDKKEKKASFLPEFGNAAMMGILGYMVKDQLKNVTTCIAMLCSALITFVIMKIMEKTGKKWLGDWNMAISILVGMLIGQLAVTLLG